MVHAHLLLMSTLAPSALTRGAFRIYSPLFDASTVVWSEGMLSFVALLPYVNMRFDTDRFPKGGFRWKHCVFVNPRNAFPYIFWIRDQAAAGRVGQVCSGGEMGGCGGDVQNSAWSLNTFMPVCPTSGVGGNLKQERRPRRGRAGVRGGAGC